MRELALAHHACAKALSTELAWSLRRSCGLSCRLPLSHGLLSIRLHDRVALKLTGEAQWFTSSLEVLCRDGSCAEWPSS